jgi:hypothetical protein
MEADPSDTSKAQDTREQTSAPQKRTSFALSPGYMSLLKMVSARVATFPIDAPTRSSYAL